MKHKLWKTAVARIAEMKSEHPETYNRMAAAVRKLMSWDADNGASISDAKIERTMAEMWIICNEATYYTDRVIPEYA